MPDNTPLANDGAVQLAKRTPGFQAKLLKIRKNTEVPERGLIHRLIYGQESPHIIVPIKEHRVEGMQVIVKPYGGRIPEKSYSLLNVARPMFIGKSGLPKFEDENFYTEGDIIHYLEYDGKEEEIKRADLINDFETDHIEHRTYLLGTDESGRDMLSRILYGTRISLSIGFVAVLISMLLGVSLGSLAGFFGGKIDAIIMWFMSVIWSIPGIMLVIAISLALNSRGVWVAFVAVGLTMWVEVARVVRGQIMSIKEKLYIEAARAVGVGNLRIIYAHILPNIFGPLIVIATANFASAILLEAGLSFLGLSVQPPTPSWGIMIFEGFRSIGTPGSWHMVLIPGLAICIMVLAFNLLGNGLRDAYDPKTMFK